MTPLETVEAFISSLEEKNIDAAIDLLDEDKPIAGQKFACISFVSPEAILKKKELFYFEEFLKHWDYSQKIQYFTQFLNFLSHKYCSIFFI